MGNRELLAVKAALEEWRHWLEGANHPFIIWTDEKNLEWSVLARPGGRFSLSVSPFSLPYRLESRNIKPDALSRLFDPEHVAKEPENILPLTCVVGAVTWQTEKEVKQANGEALPPSGFVPVELHPQVIH